MKNKIISIVVAGIVTLITLTAIAEENDDIYVGIQYGFGEFSSENISEDFRPDVIVTRFGKSYNDIFSLEVRLGVQSGGDTKTSQNTGDTVTLELDRIVGLYGVLNQNLGETFSVYGLIGVTYAKASTNVVTTNLNGLQSSFDDNGLSLGIGFNKGLGNKASLYLEYVSYVNNTEFDYSAVSAGIAHGF